MKHTLKLVFGVCGIGRGHLSRQQPLIEHYLHSSRIAIFAFGESYIFYAQFYRNNPEVLVIEVRVPWIYGSSYGIDFLRTANEQRNKASFVAYNFKAMQRADEFLGKPDLVISDYEPVSAQYSYALRIPLVTVDQQSKYLLADSREMPTFGDLTPNEEIARLSLFFPKAYKRIATSFFHMRGFNDTEQREQVIMTAPILKSEVLQLSNKARKCSKSLIVYISSYSNFPQDPADVISILHGFKDYLFFVYAKAESNFFDIKDLPPNVHILEHGTSSFLRSIEESMGIISTSGHTLLSEMMYLNKPVYAIPLDTYEQHYNAKVISDNHFGKSSPSITKTDLRDFIDSLERYALNIRNDHDILRKTPGQSAVISIINETLKSI